MIAPGPPPCRTRLADTWRGGTDRDGKTVVAEYRARAPARLRRSVRELTVPEQRLWLYLADRAFLGADAFAQVPVHLPAVGYGRVLTFFVPRVAVAIEVTDFDFKTAGRAQLDRFAWALHEDEILRDHGGILTLRCFAAPVRRDPRASAKNIRWELGLGGEAPPEGVFGLQLPRA